MNIREFITLSEVEVDYDTFELMENLYMNCSEEITKEILCDQYKKLYNQNCIQFEKQLTNELMDTLKHNNRMINRYNHEMELKTNKQIVELFEIFKD